MAASSMVVGAVAYPLMTVLTLAKCRDQDQ